MPTPLDRALRALFALVQAITHRVDYLAWYRAEVLAQDGDGLVSLRPANPRLPLQTEVPIRGIAGAVVSITPGTSVLFGFENGERLRPIVVAWNGSLSRLTITASTRARVQSKVALSADRTPVARKGDFVVLDKVGPIKPLPPGPKVLPGSTLFQLNLGLPLSGGISSGTSKTLA